MFCATHHSFVTLRGRSNVNVHMKHLWHVVDKLELFYRKKKRKWNYSVPFGSVSPQINTISSVLLKIF